MAVLSLKCLAFDVLVTPDKETGVSRLQSACIEGDLETFVTIQNNSPSKLDSVTALDVKIGRNSFHFPGKSVWTVLQLQQKSTRHKQIFKLVETICQEFRSQSLLHLTAREGQVHHIRRMLDYCSEQIDTADNDWSGEGHTPLMLAARFNDEEVVDFLVERGASLEMCDCQGRTSLHHAAEGGRVRNLIRLIELGVDVLQTDRMGYSALHLAALSGHTNAVRLLIEHGANVSGVTVQCSFDGPSYTPLALAAKKGHLETVKVLLQNGGSLDKGNKIAWLPLHFAAEGDHTEVVKFLLDNDGNVLAQTAHGKTVLHLATQLELVKILVDHGANIQARDVNSRTPLHVAAEKGQTDTVEYLLDRGADINARDNDGLSPLYCALKGGHATTARFLIDKGSISFLSNDPSLLSVDEAELLQSSARDGSTSVLQILLSGGLSADTIHSESTNLLTALEEAARSGHCDTVRFLLDQGANIDGHVASRAERLRERKMKQDSRVNLEYWRNISPLYAALYAGQGEAARILIERGANVSNLNCDRFQTLIDLTAKYGHFDVLELLGNYTIDNMEDFRFKDGETILTSAVVRMDFELVTRLLQNGLDVNRKDERGNSALHKVFCQVKQNSDPHKTMAMFKLLVSFGADINALSKNFTTPLHYAVKLGAEKVISLMLELDCKMNFEDTPSGSPLLLAALRGNCTIVGALLQCGADVNQTCGKDERTPLHASVTRAYTFDELAQVLLQHGANLEAEDVLGETPLTKAVIARKRELVKLFVDWGSNVNTVNRSGETPLMKAVELEGGSDVSIVMTLLEHGALVNATDLHGRSALHRIYRNVEICKLLVDYGSDVNITDDNGETPLHHVTYDSNSVKVLLDHGADVGALDRENRTPLHAACYEGDCSCVEVLIERGADVNSADNKGWLPLHIAAARENYNAAEMLIQSGSKVAAVDKTGRTALHLAGKCGSQSIVELLLSHGSCINGKDFRGLTLLGTWFECNMTEDFYYWDFVKYYLEHGGDMFAVEEATGRTILHFAASHQYVSTVDNLIVHGLDLEARDKNGETPLHRAVARGTEEIVQHLVNAGADLRAVNRKGQTPMLKSLASHRSNVLLRLKPDVHQADVYGNTPLHLAIYKPRTLEGIFYNPSSFSEDDVAFLLKAGASVHCQDKQGNTPLHIAAAEGCFEIVELLIKAGSNVNSTNIQGGTCLHMACYSGSLDILQTLIAHGAELNAVDELGCTPLHIAMTFHNYWVAEALVKSGSNPKAVDYKGSTPLHAGCGFDGYDGMDVIPVFTRAGWIASTVEWLSVMINHGSDLEAKDNKGCTALHICAVFDQTRIASQLLKHGADVDARDNEGSTPLHLAAAFGNDLVSKQGVCDMVSLLLEYGANVSLRDSEGSLPLHTAASFGKTRMVRKLILGGSEVNAVDVRGDSPLHASAGSGHLDVVRLLLDSGADLFAVDNQGLTAAQCAEKFGHKKTKNFIKEREYLCS